MPSIDFTEICSIKNAFKINTNFEVFVETGTLHGDTINNIANNFSIIHSVELSPLYYSYAKQRFQSLNHIHIHFGDSSKILPSIIDTINLPTIFFLDGHWSGANTAKGEKDCPLIEELIYIVNFFNEECLIIIDDYRLFGTKTNEDWTDITDKNIENIIRERKIISNINNDRLSIHLRKKNQA
jgi:hypothetical protein